jgi:hypothetical protein
MLQVCWKQTPVRQSHHNGKQQDECDENSELFKFHIRTLAPERNKVTVVEIDHWGEQLTGCPTCNRW